MVFRCQVECIIMSCQRLHLIDACMFGCMSVTKSSLGVNIIGVGWDVVLSFVPEIRVVASTLRTETSGSHPEVEPSSSNLLAHALLNFQSFTTLPKNYRRGSTIPQAAWTVEVYHSTVYLYAQG